MEYDHTAAFHNQIVSRQIAEDYNKGRAAILQSVNDRLAKDNSSACELVANMHAAAVGQVCGPREGVVEDVRNLREQALKLRRALVGLVGVDDKKELEGMAAMLRLAPISESEKAVTVNAINAILDTQTL